MVKKEVSTNWEDYFKLPLKEDQYDPSMVWTEDNKKAFDISREVDSISCKLIVDKLNGKNKIPFNVNFTYDNGTIYLVGKTYIDIRSWGRLTGTGGGLGLHPDIAAKIQDNFAEWIIKKLKEE